MLSSVVGFDIGYNSCYVSIARGGGIEIVDNEYSKRENPSVVGYGSCSDGRKISISAKTLMSRNLKHTVSGFKPFIGRNYTDPLIQSNIESSFNDLTQIPENKIGFNIQYQDSQIVLTPENVTSSLLTYLKDVAAKKLGFAVNDCVISVPLHYSEYQRRAMIFAAQAAGLNVLRLFNEPTATALAYGIYKQDLPAEKEKSRVVIFCDMGDNCTQVSAVAFNKGKLVVLKSLSDPNLGGRHFGEKIFNILCEEFKKTYKIDVNSRPRAILRLQTECEKLKKTMSANNTNIPLFIESFMDDKDVKSEMSRDTFESASADLFERFQLLLQQLLLNSPVKVEDIDAVEIVGGSTRIPKIKKIIEETFHKTVSTTLNADESVARGCALQCAILSPAFKVRDFTINDVVSAGIKLEWFDPNGTLGGEMEVFKPGDVFPFTKMLTFYRKENLILKASYNTPIPHTQKELGTFKIGPITPQADGASTKVKVKVKIDLHGIFHVESANTAVKVVVPVEETKDEVKKEVKPEVEKEVSSEKKDGEDIMETDAAEQNGVPENTNLPDNEVKPENDNGKMENGADAVENTSSDLITEEKKTPTKTKTKTVQTPLEITTEKHGFSYKELQEAIEQENQMVSTDKLIADRLAAKNAVEEFVYEMRGKLYDCYEKFISETDREVYNTTLGNTEDWLYNDGENCNKQVYIDKLSELKKVGDKLRVRLDEFEARPAALDTFAGSLNRVRKVIDQITAGDELYNHLAEEDCKTLVEKTTEYQAKFEDYHNKSTAQNLTEDPSFFVSQIKTAVKEYESKCNPIISKPKPKVEPPPVPEEKPEETSDKQEGTATEEPMDSTDPATETAAEPTAQAAAEPSETAGEAAAMDLD